MKKHIYLDYASTTPVDERVLREMQPYFLEKFGNPGSLHRFGQEASAAVFKSRRIIAESLSADYREIIFTGSATEANNLALRGIAKSIKYYVSGIKGERKNRRNKKSIIHNTKYIIPRVIVSAIEHESILETCKDLEQDGAEVVYLPVDKNGIVYLKKLKDSLNEQTVLVSIMLANNEIGTIQRISEISKMIVEYRDELRIKDYELRKNNNPIIHNTKYIIPLFHTDAVQAFQYLNCNVNDLGADLMTLSAHKLYGPKGIGLLYVRDMRHETRDRGKKGSLSHVACRLSPIITGGGQENNLRSGTENVPYIVGFAKAVELATKLRAKELERIGKLRDYFWQRIKKIYPKAKLNGPESGKGRLPNNLNISFIGQSAEDLLIKLDLAGISASAGAACSSRAAKPSYVLRAIGLTKETAKSSIRFTLGRPTTKAEIDRAIAVLKIILRK